MGQLPLGSGRYLPLRFGRDHLRVEGSEVPVDLVYRKVGESDLEYPLECHCRVCHVTNNFRPGERPDYASFRARFQERGVWEESRGHMVASSKDERTILSIVETRDGRRVGFLWVVFADWYEQHSADINDIYVEEGFRRQGAAMQMLSYVEAEARRRGANLLISGTGVDNEVSQKLHMKYGYELRRFEYQIWL